MISIGPFLSGDLAEIRHFVEALQDHERILVPELKPGSEIGAEYCKLLFSNIESKQGLMLVARSDHKAIGFICAWIDEDDDPLLHEDARAHAYVSDIFVSESHRRLGVAGKLLKAIEIEMQKRNCKRIRICTKATNLSALRCYESNGYAAYEIILSKSLIN